MFENCLSPFYTRFYFMESKAILDVECNTQLACLQYVFLPRIQKSLDSFREAWNHHQLSSAANRSPLQLWTMGMISNIGCEYQAVDEIFLTSTMTFLIQRKTCHLHRPSPVTYLRNCHYYYVYKVGFKQ